MEKEKKLESAFFKSIKNKEEALKTIKDASYGFMFVAVLNGIIGFFIAPALIIDAIIYLILALFLLKLKSRVVAILLLILSSLSLSVTILNKIGIMAQGGNNIFLAVIIFWAAVKSIEATFKLHGRFKQNTL